MTTADAEADVIPMRAPPLSDWWTWAMRQGVFAALFIGFCSVFWTGIVIPMREDQRTFMQSVIKTNEGNAIILGKMADSQQQHATSMDRLSRSQEESNRIQQRILDATTRGAWLDHSSSPRPAPNGSD